MTNSAPAIQTPFLRSRDAAAGAFLIALGLFAYWMCRDLPRGTLRNFGPGMMPQGVALLVALTGAGVLARGYRRAGEKLERWNLRAILAILGAIVAFGLTIRGFELPGGLKIPALGMAVSVPLTVLIAGCADPDSRFSEGLIYSVVLTAICALLFKFMLGLPIPLAPWLLGQ